MRYWVLDLIAAMVGGGLTLHWWHADPTAAMIVGFFTVLALVMSLIHALEGA